jgi:hypothetical protein
MKPLFREVAEFYNEGVISSGSEAFDLGETDFNGYSFGFFHFTECKKLIDMVKNNEIKLGDLGILFALMSLVDPRTGKIKFMVKVVAEKFNYSPNAISLALSRLKKAFLLASFIDKGGEKYYMINPYLFSVGSRQRWGISIKKFFDVVNE